MSDLVEEFGNEIRVIDGAAYGEMLHGEFRAKVELCDNLLPASLIRHSGARRAGPIDSPVA
jgi:hypothetical protein